MRIKNAISEKFKNIPVDRNRRIISFMTKLSLNQEKYTYHS